VINQPYLKVSAVYSIGMLLYYFLHVFVYRRSDPTWLSELYMIIYSLPGIVSLKYLPLDLKEHTYRHYLRTAFYIFILFDVICFLTGGDFVPVKRWVSAIIMITLPLAFVALFLRLRSYNFKRTL
jgi:hypothetical protein